MLTDEELQRLYRFGYSLTTNEANAYDLLQDAIEVFIKRPPRQSVATIAYIRTTMRNRFIDGLRKQQRYPETVFDESSEALDIDTRTLDDIFIQQEELLAIWEILNPREREILFLWAVEDLSATKIGEELSLPRGTVLSCLYRLRNKVKEMPVARHDQPVGRQL